MSSIMAESAAGHPLGYNNHDNGRKQIPVTSADNKEGTVETGSTVKTLTDPGNLF